MNFGTQMSSLFQKKRRQKNNFARVNLQGNDDFFAAFAIDCMSWQNFSPMLQHFCYALMQCNAVLCNKTNVLQDKFGTK